MVKMTAWRYILFIGYGLFLIISLAFGYDFGRIAAANLAEFFGYMVQILPCAFVLIGLFEVWVDRESVERNFGKASGIMGYIWALVLSMTTVGGSYVAFPVAHSLNKKGASFSVVLTYVGAATILRVPMTFFELSFMGVRFTFWRLIVSIPLLILTSSVLGGYLDRTGYNLPDLQEQDP